MKCLFAAGRTATVRTAVAWMDQRSARCFSDLIDLDSGVKEGHKQVEVPEQPQSPFMIADGIGIEVYLSIWSVLSMF
jgi:hypothetical protein